jgi:hypothetical protein
MLVVVVLRWWFGYFRKESREYAMGHSLLSTYKRRPPLLISTTPQGKKLHHKSTTPKGLGPR